jgi:DNA-binding MarR family transcriptional regulator
VTERSRPSPPTGTPPAAVAQAAAALVPDAPYDLADAARTLAFVARGLERSLGELSVPQFRVLSFIERAPERASHVAAKAGVTKPSLTGVIDGLVAHRWVRRVEVDGDRRGVALEITASGRRALRRGSQAAARHLDEVLQPVDDHQRQAVLDGLRVLSRALADSRRPPLVTLDAATSKRPADGTPS